jgi:hypothetical protein
MNQPPAIKENENLRVEEYIKDWNWDEASHEFALQMGTFLLEFIDSLHTSGVSRNTLRKHYGHHDAFMPAVFLNGPDFLYEFKHKVSNSKYAIASYKSTWRKIEKYVRALAPKST